MVNIKNTIIKCTETGEVVKILVTGAKGQLGHDVVLELKKRGLDCLGADLQEFDITDFDAANNFINIYKPEVVIHCSAYTAVDKAEFEPRICYEVNVIGTENIAKICQKNDYKMLYISTDYVFDGNGEIYYEPDDQAKPQNVYGKTKLAGEISIQKMLEKYFIVRTSWVFSTGGNNFVKTMLKLGKERNEIKVVGDQIGSPTYTVDLAVLLCDMIQTEKYGVYNVTNEGICSWAEFAESIFEFAKLDVKVNRITTEEYPTKAIRPKNSRMSKEKLVENGFKKLPYWKDALKRCINYLDNGNIT